MSRFELNPFRRDEPDWSAPELGFLERIRTHAARDLHRALPGYAASPVRELPDLAAELGVGSILVKDESERFGIQSFKGLGPSYAVFAELARRWREATGGELTPSTYRDPEVRDTLGTLTFCAATDGNHGRAVAWTANNLGHRAVIFLPADTAPARVAHIEAEGAEARLIDGTFDDCVRACDAAAAEHGWQVIADTAYPGFMVVPGDIATGYATIFAELEEQLDRAPDIVVLPAGVGGLAAAGTAHYVQTRGSRRPYLICVEPDSSACFLESVAAGDGEPHGATGDQTSVMAGLNCGVPSLLAWPVVRDGMDLFLSVPDDFAVGAMRFHGRHGVVAGESGASTLAGLLALLRAPELAPAREAAGLGPDSRILIINTEGATDPVNYARVVGPPAVEFELNGNPVVYRGDPERSLLSWLRDEGEILSAKDGCSAQAYCWACAVEIDGKAKLSCTTPMKKIAGAAVTTLEGWPERARRIIGEAFVHRGAVQCGFCTPGYLTSVRLLLERNPDPAREDVVRALKRHWCRCTGYEAIIDAVLDAAAALREDAAAGLESQPGIGRDHPKYDAYRKAVGASPFVDDLRFDGLLHGAVVLSAHPRARVLSIDTEAALALPGVKAVFTGDDVPGERHQGLILQDWPLMVLPGEITRYVGDVIALAVAETEDQARAAAAAVAVEYEVLEPLTDMEQALTSDIHVHEGGNLVERSQVRRGGDAERILADSAHVARGTYHTQRIEHAFLEVEACVARPHDDGLLVHSQGQGVYVDRRQIASLLDLPQEKVVVKQWAAGGAFGGKEDLSVQGHAALAAFRLGVPVKVKLDREESIRMHPKRHPIRMTYEVGCDAEGNLTAVRARMVGDTGAYASVGGKVLERAAGHSTAAYHAPCVDVVADAVSTNNVPCGAMRGFGANQATFAFERCLDELCRMGGFDPWKFRRRNALVDGSMTATGQVLEEGVGVVATLDAVKPAYDEARARGRAVGLGCGIKNCGVGNGMSDWCAVKVEIAAPDRVVVHHGWTEMGQGVHTVAQQVLAQETGIAPDIVEVVTVTSSEAESGMTTSSRGTSLVGNALIEACKDLKKDLAGASLADLAGRTYQGRWSFDGSTKPGAPGKVVTHYSYSYATQLVILDEQGGVEKVVAAHDAGRIMNPALFRGQITGSVHMGLGYALSEDLPMEGGHLVTTKLNRLGMLPMHRMPEVDVIGVEVRDPLGPYGAKGVGEVGLVPTAGAVGNAFSAFDGKPRTHLPLEEIS